MYSRIRKRFTYTNVAMTLALVFAMTGGAYAAGKYLITSTKQIKPSVLKSLKGNAGHAGVPGANGAAGPQGAGGANGANGKDGINGTNGKDGKDGSPWTAGGTLPKGATETGQWAISQWHKAGEFLVEAISFPIPLAHELDVGHVHLIGVSEPVPPGCAGGSATEPKAESGNLCVYEQQVNNLLPASFGLNSASTFGALLTALVGVEGEVVAIGSWAVTG
jgi:hypothetical protein